MSDLQGYFKRQYGPLRGQKWLLTLPKYEQQAFALFGRSKALHGVLGGKARAQEAGRDRKGRFVKDGN